MIIKYTPEAINQAIGNVITQERIIDFNLDISITFLSFQFFIFKYCLNNHIPNIQPKAI